MRRAPPGRFFRGKSLRLPEASCIRTAIGFISWITGKPRAMRWRGVEMTELGELHDRWSADADYRDAYQRLGPEFELAGAPSDAGRMVLRGSRSYSRGSDSRKTGRTP